MESKTPRTDAELKLEACMAFMDGFGVIEVVQIDFARQLETELAEAKKRFTAEYVRQISIKLLETMKEFAPEEDQELKHDINHRRHVEFRAFAFILLALVSHGSPPTPSLWLCVPGPRGTTASRCRSRYKCPSPCAPSHAGCGGRRGSTRETRCRAG